MYEKGRFDSPSFFVDKIILYTVLHTVLHRLSFLPYIIFSCIIYKKYTEENNIMCENNDKSQSSTEQTSQPVTPVKLPFNKETIKVKPLDRNRETKPRQ